MTNVDVDCVSLQWVILFRRCCGGGGSRSWGLAAAGGCAPVAKRKEKLVARVLSLSFANKLHVIHVVRECRDVESETIQDRLEDLKEKIDYVSGQRVIDKMLAPTARIIFEGKFSSLRQGWWFGRFGYNVSVHLTWLAKDEFNSKQQRALSGQLEYVIKKKEKLGNVPSGLVLYALSKSSSIWLSFVCSTVNVCSCWRSFFLSSLPCVLYRWAPFVRCCCYVRREVSLRQEVRPSGGLRLCGGGPTAFAPSSEETRTPPTRRERKKKKRNDDRVCVDARATVIDNAITVLFLSILFAL